MYAYCIDNSPSVWGNVLSTADWSFGIIIMMSIYIALYHVFFKALLHKTTHDTILTEREKY